MAAAVAVLYLGVGGAEAQGRNPYFQLQCSLTGAYCNRVHETAPAHVETFDEFLARKQRQNAQREIDRQQKEERERAQRAADQREKEAREEQRREEAERARETQRRQALAAEQSYRQMIAERIAAAPPLIRWLYDSWPIPQWLLVGLLGTFALIAGIGRSVVAKLDGSLFYGGVAIALFAIFFTYRAAEAESPWYALSAALAPTCAFITFNVLNAVRGWHYLFVAHPAAGFINPALRTETLFQPAALGGALRPDVRSIQQPPPVYQSDAMRDKARSLKDRIEADGDLAVAAMRRDRARAEKARADAEWRAARSKLPWWQRWRWW